MSTEDKSSKIKEALRQGFLDGTSKMANRKCFGYDRTADGSLMINQEESGIVQWIFESYRDGASFGEIANELERRRIPSPTGKGKWNREAISKLLSNEKYIGDILLQKTKSKDGYQTKNQGDLSRVLIKNHHSAIVSGELFRVVQRAKLERSKRVADELKLKMSTPGFI